MTVDDVQGRTVTIEGADGEVRVYRRHRNGGGLVDVTATVADGAAVHESAYVEADSVLGDGTRVGAGCWIESGATIGDDVGRVRRAVLVKARVAMVTIALSHVPVRQDPDALIVPDHL